MSMTAQSSVKSCKRNRPTAVASNYRREITVDLQKDVHGLAAGAADAHLHLAGMNGQRID